MTPQNTFKPGQHKALLAVTCVMLLSALFLIWFRGGILSWAGLVISVAMLVKLLAKPGQSDVKLCIAGITAWGISWGFAAYLVFNGWEAGEVIELVIETDEGTRTARTWVVDSGTVPVIIYDTNMAAIKALQSQQTVILTRDGEQSERQPYVTLAEEAEADYLTHIYSLFGDKYGPSSSSTTTFYKWMGGPRNRQVAIVELRPL
ncbi:MAG: hypothetical protein COA96_15225 [SAR86 cluster bacterium]|uniref:Uncharacterized protein n=1 Tax=SAR86 cluster bacterium TaxID=2030880 RepID=A0A2A5ARS7_9GAMM|nr:MAG: hypothetical protein COA96_15225 [SAR86 cluster bacterium]